MNVWNVHVPAFRKRKSGVPTVALDEYIEVREKTLNGDQQSVRKALGSLDM